MPRTFDPRPHQQRAIDAVAAEFATTGEGTADRATVVMMCGTGKTLTGQRMTERLIADGIVPATGRILMLFPSLALVQQTFDGWVAQQRAPFRAVAFCSGSSPTSKSRGMVDESGFDDLTMDRTTDPDRLAKWLLHEDADNVLSVAFGTYQSSPRIADMHSSLDVAEWDLVVCDEAHNTTGDLSGPFATVLHQNAIPARRRVFMTATPKVHTRHGKTIAKASDLGVSSMNDQSIYGRRVISYALPDAVADDVLSDYEVAVMAVSDAQISDYLSRNPGLLSGDSPKARALAESEALAAIAMFRAAKQYDLHRLLTFHATVEAAGTFSSHLPTILDTLDDSDLPPGVADRASVQFLTVRGADGPEHREYVKRALGATENDALTVLANCKVFAEGVDVPTLDGLVMADARRSPTEVTQIVGRIIRKNAKRSEKSVLVLPVVVSPGDDPQTMLATSTFEKVWQTLVALAEHDMTMAADMERAIEQRAFDLDDWGTHTPTPPVTLTTAIPDVAPSTPETAAAPVPAPAVSTVPDDQTGPAPADPGSAPEQPAKSLSKVTFVGVDDVRDPASIVRSFEMVAVERCVDSWDTFRVKIEAYHRTHGRWPVKSTNADETSLHFWLVRQRSQERNGTLGKDRIEVLDAMSERLGSDWMLDRESAWDASLASVEAHYREHGQWPASGTLHTWLGTQQKMTSYGRMTEARLAKMSEMETRLGATFLNGRSVHWRQVLGRLEGFCRRRGTLPTEADGTVFTWLMTQRRKVREGAMSAERIGLLNEMSQRTGVDWNPGFEGAWMDRLSALEAFFVEHGRWPSTKGDSDLEAALGRWLSQQRIRQRKGEMSQQRKQALSKMAARVGSPWDPSPESRYGDQAATCEAFYAEHGRWPMPSARLGESEKSPGVWLQNQRNKDRRGTLPAWQQEVLDAMSQRLGAPWHTKRAASAA